MVILVLARSEARAQSCAFDTGALPVDTLPPGTLHGPAIPVEHIVVMMQENRSYDHYFGRLRPKYWSAARHDQSRSAGWRSDQAVPPEALLRGGRPRPFLERDAPGVEQRRDGRLHRRERRPRRPRLAVAPWATTRAATCPSTSRSSRSSPRATATSARSSGRRSRTATTSWPARRSVTSTTPSRTCPARNGRSGRSSTSSMKQPRRCRGRSTIRISPSPRSSATCGHSWGPNTVQMDTNDANNRLLLDAQNGTLPQVAFVDPDVPR